jgi:hypothetical protein
MKESDNSDSGLDGRSNTGDWSRNKNTNNSGIIAGHGSKNTVNNGPSITANMFEGASGITLNGGMYNNVAGGNSELVIATRMYTNLIDTVCADGHPKQRKTM